VANEDTCVKFGTHLVQIWYKFQNLVSSHAGHLCGHKIPLFDKIQDGGSRHLEFYFFAHISVVNEIIV